MHVSESATSTWVPCQIPIPYPTTIACTCTSEAEGARTPSLDAWPWLNVHVYSSSAVLIYINIHVYFSLAETSSAYIHQWHDLCGLMGWMCGTCQDWCGSTAGGQENSMLFLASGSRMLQHLADVCRSLSTSHTSCSESRYAVIDVSSGYETGRRCYTSDGLR